MVSNRVLLRLGVVTSFITSFQFFSTYLLSSTWINTSPVYVKVSLVERSSLLVPSSSTETSLDLLDPLSVCLCPYTKYNMLVRPSVTHSKKNTSLLHQRMKPCFRQKSLYFVMTIKFLWLYGSRVDTEKEVSKL